MDSQGFKEVKQISCAVELDVENESRRDRYQVSSIKSKWMNSTEMGSLREADGGGKLISTLPNV